MATDLEQKPQASTPKYESFVEQQIARVRGRVRAQDAGKAGLLFLIFTLVYGLGMALADRAWELSPLTRLGAFGVFAVGGAGLLGWALMCLIRRVNPYYAAKQLEETMADAKNSVVNWLDLRDKKLPPVIHSALGLRAARDLKKADPEQAVNAGPTWILAAVLGGLLLALLILFVMGPAQFASLMQRTFFPFREGAIETLTTIEMVEPEGSAVVPPSRAITFRARIDGRIPPVNQEGAPKLLWRYSESDPFVGQALDKDFDDSWTWTMPADQVINGGLWYKVTAGDTETPEYQIRVSAIPQVRAFDVTYHYRAYERKSDAKIVYPKAVFGKLHARRGTEVTLHVQTNCDVANGHLEITWDNKTRTDLPAQMLPDDPGTLRFPKFMLDGPGSFRVVFTSRDGKSNIDDQSQHQIIVYEEKPTVEIVKPKNISLPLNGTLQVEGAALSTNGIKGMTLRMKQKDNGPELEAKPYRPGKSFKLANGSYPPILEYKDFVALEKLKTAKGEPFPLSAGMKLDYWLEAVDSADYPDVNGNLGKSEHFTVTILDAEKDQTKQKQDREKAKQQKKQHDQKQDQNLEQQSKDTPEAQGGNTAKSEEQKKKEDEARNAAKDIQEKLGKKNPEKKQPPDQPNKNDQKPSSDPNKQNPDPKPDGQPQPKEQQPNESKAKDANQPQADSKDGKSENQAPQPQSKDKKQPNKEQPGKEKDSGKNGTDKKPGESKDDGQKSGEKGPQEKQPKGGEAKDKGKKDGDGGQPGAGKDESAGGDKGQKPEAKPGPAKEQSGQAKNKGKGTEGQEKQTSQAKEGPADSTRKTDHGQAKGKDEPAKNAKAGEKKGPASEPQAKAGNPKAPPGETKTSDAKTETAGTAKEKSSANRIDQGNGSGKNEKFREPTPEEIARLAKDLKSGNPQAQQEAEKRLTEICRECKNPGSQKAAGEALSENNKAPFNAKPAEGPDKTAKAESKDQGEGKPGQPKDGEAKTAPPDAQPGAGKSEGPGESDPDRGGIGQAKGEMMKPGSWGGGRHGYESKVAAKAPHEDLSNRGGNLTLEDMRKLLKLTEKERKEAGINDDVWRRFTKAMADYERDLQKRNATAGTKNGKLQDGVSQMSSSGPAQLDPTSNRKVDRLDYSRALPPPEFREAQRRFTDVSTRDKK